MSSAERIEVIKEEPDIVAGKKFGSHAEVQEFIYNLEVQTRQKYAVNDSRTISAARSSRGVKRFLKPELVYYSITYTCIHGGSKYKSKSRGMRQSSTFKMDCPAKIRFVASKDGNHLEIVSYIEKHVGHGLSERVYEHLPQVRRLNKADVKEVQQFLEVGWNSKLLQTKLMLDKGKKVTLKDINNIKYKWKGAGDVFNSVKYLKTEGDDSDDFLKAAKFLEEEYEANASLLQDEMQNFKAFYFSTEEMRRSMLAFPEIVFLDGSYKLHNDEMTLMLMVVEDANGLSEIVGVCVICDDDYETFKWFLTRFKEDNDAASESIKCLMTDKDLLHRDVLNEVFDDVPVYICNRLESLSQKMKTVIPPNNSLCLFFKCFMNWLISHNEEINSKVAKMILKKAVTKFDENSCEKKYMDLLTPYAYSYVLRQCALSKKVTLIEEQDAFKVKIKEGLITVDILTCECSDFISMLLPCRHILCLRSRLDLPLYSEELCNKRWLKENYLNSYRVKLGDVENVPLFSESKPKIYATEKRKRANTITSNLVNLAFVSSDSQFEYRMDCLKEIELLWRQGYEVQINKIDTEEDEYQEIIDESQIEYDSEVDMIATDETEDGTITDQNEEVPSISSIETPPEFKRKGESKEYEVLTVVGLKKKRKVRSGPTVFASKPDEMKKKQILNEIVSDCDLVARCLEGEYKITSLDVKNVEDLSHCLLNPAMDLRLVEDFFEPIAFMSVKQKIESLEENNVWRCAVCDDEVGEVKSVTCDSCLKRYHFQCAAISKVPVRKTWFCSACS